MKQDRHRHNVSLARMLRARETWAEDLLWEALRGHRLDGLKFRRQHPIGPFIVDFCCTECRLAIELDGDVHADQREYDSEREVILVAAGYTVLRIANEQVRDNLTDVLATIQAASRAQPLWHPPVPGRRTGM
jgi:very-short-patch-repair endonuclease